MDTNDRFEALVNQMMKVRKRELSPTEIDKIHEIAKALAPLSKRHHYIPEFFIEGFEDEHGMVYKYDKEKDLLTKQRFPSKSVFYEWGRNSFDSNGIPISIIEDRLYSELDSGFSQKLKDMLRRSIHDVIKDKDTRAFLVALSINFFWRSPISDGAAERLFAESTISFTDPHTGEKFQDPEREAFLRTDPFYIQMQRAMLFKTTIDRILEENRQDPQTQQLHSFSDNTFLLGDYPILYREVPSTFPDLMHVDYFFPISSGRLYASHRYDDLPLGEYDIHRINALIIDQSKRMVVSADYEFLEKSVRYWKMLKEKIPMRFISERLFDAEGKKSGS